MVETQRVDVANTHTLINANYTEPAKNISQCLNTLFCYSEGSRVGGVMFLCKLIESMFTNVIVLNHAIILPNRPLFNIRYLLI